MIKKSSNRSLYREAVYGANCQELITNGAFEYFRFKAGLMPKRVEPRKVFSSLMV